MHDEEHELKKCCFCLPLSKGFIGWGYFRLVLNVLAIINVLAMYLRMNYLLYYGEIILFMAVIVYYFTDAVFAIFLIAYHGENHKILRLSHIYCITWLTLILILGASLIYIETCWVQRVEDDMDICSFENIMLNLSLTLIVILVQVYVILLTRTEEIKLRKENLGEQFVNNPADVELI